MTWTIIVVMMGVLMPTGSRPSEQGEMLSLLKRHEIQVLLRAGFTVADVAKRAEVSVDSVRRVRKEDAVTHTDDSTAHAERRIGRASEEAQLSERVKGWLEDEPEMPSQGVPRRA